MVPPFEEHALADELEPWRELQRFILEHSLEVLLRDPARISYFIRVDVEINIGLDEQDVVN